MAKNFYRLPLKDIRAAIASLAADGALIPQENGWITPEDAALLEHYTPAPPKFVYALHRNDVLYRACEPELKAWIAALTESLPYDHEPLQYLLIDGEFRGATVGHFRNGPYDLNDVVCDLPAPESRRNEILAAVRSANFGKAPLRFMGNEVLL